MSGYESGTRFSTLISPKEDLFVIGDVHGAFPKLERLLEMKQKSDCRDARIVFVGDLVDRGEYSNNVLLLVAELVSDGAVVIRGNHEEMMQNFLENPSKYGRRWLRYGGLQTMQSFGIRVDPSLSGGDYFQDLSQQLLDKMTSAQHALIVNDQLSYRSGNIFVGHAGADYSWPLDQQNSHSLLWGSEDMKYPRRDEHWVVHGHVVVDQPLLEPGRINVDTGAYASGKLTGAFLSDVYAGFLST